MDKMTKIQTLAFLLLFCLFHRGDALCSLSDLAVTQSAVPGKAGEYAVAVENRCICTQSKVKLSCAGFRSTIPVDAGVLSVDNDGEHCTLLGGGAVHSGDVVRFTYAWSRQFDLAPASSSLACS